MRKLGEQWVERLEDGKEHMLKVVERHMKDDFDCSGCFFNDHTGKCLYGTDCPIGEVEHGYIKDLGILRDGLLPCPFCGEYPIMSNNSNGCFVSCDECYIPQSSEPTEQQAKDAWNRRS